MNTSSSFIEEKKMAVLNCIGIRSSQARTINLYDEKFDWLFIVDPI